MVMKNKNLGFGNVGANHLSSLRAPTLQDKRISFVGKRLDFSLSRALQGMIRSSGESLSEDVTLKASEFSQKSNILRGRQIVWMMIDRLLYNKSITARAVHLARH